MDTLTSGLGLLESPRWSGDRLWFADWTAGQILTLDEAGRREVVAEHASLPLCFDFLPDGSALVVSGPSRALLRLGPDGALSTYADLAPLSPYGCNDIVVDSRGNAYVNNGNAEFGTMPPPGRVAVDRGAFACMLGGADRSTLYIVGAKWPGAQHLMDHNDWDGTVWSVPAPAPGAGWPGPRG